MRLTGQLRLVDGVPYLVGTRWDGEECPLELKIELRNGDRITVERPDHHDYAAAR